MAIAPAAYISAAAVPLLWARVMVAIVWALIPDLSIALTGAIVGKSLINSGATSQPAQQSNSRSKKTAQQKSKTRAMTEQIACKWQCGLSGTKAAMNAHSRFCTKNPANQFEKVAQQAIQ